MWKRMLFVLGALGLLGIQAAGCSHVDNAKAGYYDWRAERNAKAGNYGTAQDYERRAAQKRQDVYPAPPPPTY